VWGHRAGVPRLLGWPWLAGVGQVRRQGLAGLSLRVQLLEGGRWLGRLQGQQGALLEGWGEAPPVRQQRGVPVRQVLLGQRAQQLLQGLRV